MKTIMRVDDSTIQAAFEQHFIVMSMDEKRGITTTTFRCGETARKAFGQSSFADFQKLYQSLRSYWQVFRGSDSHWSDRQTFDVLAAFDSRLARSRLSCIDKHDLPAIWGIINSVQDIKVNKTGPSVVAASKFLHFWNPRLFVIVDDGIVWKWVFAHKWLREQVERTRLETDSLLLGAIQKHDDTACDLSTYIAVLTWASRLVQNNPSIVSEFDKYIRKRATVSVSDEVAEYEAVAVEWFCSGWWHCRPPG